MGLRWTKKSRQLRNCHPHFSERNQEFLRPCGFLHEVHQDFSTLLKSLSSLLMHGVPFCFDDKCMTTFTTLKDNLTSTPIVIATDWELPFELMCDASDYAVGAVLG